MGCFVPARAARISLVDRIFVRSGASDMISRGLSTFMVEMVETAHILNYSTKNSLVIMDEIGRGTSTYDGISIASAVAEYLVTHFKIPPKTLFATHYHELQKLETEYPDKIKNYHMAVESEKNTPIFLYTLTRGGASHSFGVAVARLAGVPERVVRRAQTLLLQLEEGSRTRELTSDKKNSSDEDVLQELKDANLNKMTPLDALNFLAQLKENLPR
jgi:DNA mismatch repair protein MutS